MKNAKPYLNESKLSKSADVLRAVTHPLRMQLLEFIDQHEKINVNRIYNTLNLEQSITSQHLRILRNSDLVNTQRDGKFIFYSVNYDKLNRVVGSVTEFVNNR